MRGEGRAYFPRKVYAESLSGSLFPGRQRDPDGLKSAWLPVDIPEPTDEKKPKHKGFGFF